MHQTAVGQDHDPNNQERIDVVPLVYCRFMKIDLENGVFDSCQAFPTVPNALFALPDNEQGSMQDDVAVPNLIIKPAWELHFCGPFDKKVTTPLTIINPASNCVLFKIKTTKPECYNVQTNIGRLGPRQKMKVEITLKPQERDLAAERDLHKFLVESMFAPSDLTDLESMHNLMRQRTNQKRKTILQCDFRYPAPTSPDTANEQPR